MFNMFAFTSTIDPADFQKEPETMCSQSDDPTQHDSTSRCGCTCICHTDEATPEWPGSCAGCCEPGDDCKCGRALADLDIARSIHDEELLVMRERTLQPVVSPWVRRNLDSAQYAQPRGSEYEG